MEEAKRRETREGGGQREERERMKEERYRGERG